jgi:hypothetical protein
VRRGRDAHRRLRRNEEEAEERERRDAERDVRDDRPRARGLGLVGVIRGARLRAVVARLLRVGSRADGDVILVGIDEDESPDTASTLVKRYGLTFPVLRDDGNVLSGRFRVSSMPMSFVADASGRVRWVGDEKQSEEDLRRAVEAAR